jgi:hypothetical protein
VSSLTCASSFHAGHGGLSAPLRCKCVGGFGLLHFSCEGSSRLHTEGFSLQICGMVWALGTVQYISKAHERMGRVDYWLIN